MGGDKSENKKSNEAKKKNSKERKSLKGKVKETDLVVFLTERRAVSESRFRVMDAIGNPTYLVRTKSDQSIADESWSSGIAPGAVRETRTKFEDPEEFID